MILKFSAACHAVRSVVHISDVTGLKLTYFTYFHSIIKYGIIAWGNSSIDGKLFTLKKKIILRIMVSGKPRLPHVEVHLRNYRFCLFHPYIYIYIYIYIYRERERERDGCPEKIL